MSAGGGTAPSLGSVQSEGEKENPNHITKSILIQQGMCMTN